jgi:hypothetical protein
VTWKPKWAPGVDLKALSLTNVEGFLASRIDGNTNVSELALLTNLPAEQVSAVLQRLTSEGALLPDPEAPIVEAETETLEPEPEVIGQGATHLALYRERFHHLSSDERASIAATANGAVLSALCYDPLPAVIRKVMENPLAGPEQARLIAAHHQNSAGLEFLLAHGELMRDSQVQRLLWRNPQLNEGQLRRITQSKRLLELWKLSTSRETTSQTRTNTQRLLRTRFTSAPAEERVELIFTTEGRALAGLSGLPVDSKTTALLCARTYSSMLLVQNIAHWSAAPPQLISHLIKQPLVMRQPRLRTMLAQHPNAPADAKLRR